MANLFDYITWRGDLSFSCTPFNPVDNVIFSQLSYLPFEYIIDKADSADGIGIGLAAKLFDDYVKKPHTVKSGFMFKDDPELIKALALSRRFGNCYITNYVNLIDVKREVQFSALCVCLDDGSNIVVFRGTDKTFVGWKEDFNMSFSEVVPAQLEAVKYLEKTAPMLKGPLKLCGHSKGGNLAVFAASKCRDKIKKRITEIYSNDAPGFHKSVIETEGFKEIKSRIKSFIPQSSVVGLLLESAHDYKVIKSSKVGLMQHELYSWEMTYNDMIYVDQITPASRFVDKTIREWIGGLNKEQREQFIEALYSIFTATEAHSLPDVNSSWIKAAQGIFKSISNMKKEKRQIIGNSLTELFRAAGKNIDILMKFEKNGQAK